MRKKTLRRRGLRLLLLATAMSVIAAGVSYAAIPNSQTGVINGCYEKRTGLLRVIDAQAGKTCFTQYETPISWNQQGAPGSVTSIIIQDGTLKAADFTTDDADGLTSANIKNESLSGDDLVNDSVTDGDIQDGTLRSEEFTTDDASGLKGANVKDESLSGADLANGSVTNGDIQNATLEADEFTTENANGLTSANVKDGSLSGDDLESGSVATTAIQANAVNVEADFRTSLNSFPTAGSPVTVASATIMIPAAGSLPAAHKVLVIGQAIVRCLCPNGGHVEWHLFDGAGPGAARLQSGQPYSAGFSDTFITPVSHMITVPAGTHTIALKVTNVSGSGVPMDATQASLSLIDLGSV